MNDTVKLITIAILENMNNKIIKEETIDEFLNRYKKDEILRSMLAYHLTNNLLGKIIVLETTTKKEVIKYAHNNLENIYSGLFEIMNEEYFYFFNDLIKNKGYIKININKLYFPIGFILFINRNLLASVKYHKKEEVVEIFINKEILNIIRKIISNKHIKQENEKNNKVRYNLHAILNTYGVIDLDNLHDIYNKKFAKISKNKLLTKIELYRIIDEDIRLFGDGNMYLIGNISFKEDDDAFSFYYGCEKKEYKIFSNKEDYYRISEGGYLDELKELDEIVDILYDYEEIDENEISDFIEMIVLDYISMNQTEPETADKNLTHNLEKAFNYLLLKDKIKIKKLIKEISNQYPSWHLKGYSINEVKQTTK